VLNLSGRELLSLPDPPLRRLDYIRAGVALMLLKYAVDAALIYWVTGVVWTPADYLLSLANISSTKASRFTMGLSFTLIVWTIPFVWLGVLLSVRRAKDAGLPVWIVVGFFIPAVNYLLMAVLAGWPSTRPLPTAEDYFPRTDEANQRLVARKGLLAGVSAGLAAGLGSVVLGVLLINTYGVVMFLMTPFAVGLVSGFAARRVDPRADLPLNVVMCTLGVVAAAVMVFAIEGLVCLLMAVPIAVPTAVLGGLVGHHMARDRRTAGAMSLMLLLVPAGHGIDRAIHPTPIREVLTSIEIAAPPDIVWQHVVSFEEIRTPPEWYFRTGLAYPLRAKIEGTGVRAVRHCEFTTGSFIERITAWDRPYRLAFDVVAQPPPLQEWSPYRSVYAPHLDGFFRTTKGEFRLVELAGGRTRLEGRTWYALRMQPQSYWTILADAIVHRIHERVLEHIRSTTEGR
jgi:hypothetical protein